VVQGRDSADDKYRRVLDQPALELWRDLTGVELAGHGLGTQVVAWWKKGQLVNRRPRVPRMLQHEIDQGLGPPCFRRGYGSAEAMALQGRYDGLPVQPEGPVPRPEVPLIGMPIRLTLMNEVAGAAADQETRNGLDAALKGLQRLLLTRCGQVCRDAARQHGANFTQGEWAGDIEEVAQESGNEKRKR
jgi:hypothetical protein